MEVAAGEQDLEHHREIAKTIHCQQAVPAGSQCYGCGLDWHAALGCPIRRNWGKSDAECTLSLRKHPNEQHGKLGLISRVSPG